MDALEALCRDPDAAVRALGLGPRSAAEVLLNRGLRAAPTLPAIDRFDGVLFDSLDASSLTPQARRFAGRHVLIHTALLGPIAALDPVPNFRLSDSARLPGRGLRAIWRDAVSQTLSTRRGLVLDLRSKGYAELGPAPGALGVHVVSEDAAGRRRALNHFNKAAKGALVRRMLDAGIAHRRLNSLLDWAAAEGIRLERSLAGEPGELTLVAESVLPPR